MILATKDDNLDSIIEKILSQDNLDSKLSIYRLFYITHSHYIPGINTLLQIKDPELWKLIRKSFYPTIFDKIMKLTSLFNKQNLIILMLVVSLFSNIYMYIIFDNHINSNTNENKFNVQNSIANQLCSLGFNEMMANSLTTANYTQFSEMLKEEHNVRILNPLSNDLAIMRQSLLFSGLEAISYNINRKNTDLKLFEFGKTYHNYPSGYEEKKHLTLFLTGNRNQETWTIGQKPTDAQPRFER
jgi:hemoglobin-like flavoprotein